MHVGLFRSQTTPAGSNGSSCPCLPAVELERQRQGPEKRGLSEFFSSSGTMCVSFMHVEVIGQDGEP